MNKGIKERQTNAEREVQSKQATATTTRSQRQHHITHSIYRGGRGLNLRNSSLSGQKLFPQIIKTNFGHSLSSLTCLPPD